MSARRVVVKVGTSTLVDAEGRLDRAFIDDLAAQMAQLRAVSCEGILVSSGAIGAGRERLGGPGRAGDPGDLPFRQAAAAVGQVVLMEAYARAFAARGCTAAQVLLTREDASSRLRFLNARNTFRALLTLGAVPVVNENDTVAVDEIRFGDNDTLAALVAVVVEADTLVMLSDVDGLHPRREDGTLEERPLAEVARIDAEIEAAACGPGTALGTGGMRTKLEAARIASGAGIRTVIAAGRRPSVLAEIAAGHNPGTTFAPSAARLRGRRRWIAAGVRPRGCVVVNAGAARALRSERFSLLAVGVTDVQGEFGGGDLVEVRDEAGRRLARGLTNYSAAEIRGIRGLRSDAIAAALGYHSYDEVIHRDNLVLTA
ncbi:MAG: glutamate 5-kinase [Chthonomonadales bacterium]|nr:glutamate 5-kinase [Chthonomonadales bacterium]